MNRNIFCISLLSLWTSVTSAQTDIAGNASAVSVSFPQSDSPKNFSSDAALQSDSPKRLSFTVNPQQRFHKSIPPGNYSGIAYLGDNRYALVSDKAAEDGFHIFRIDLDSVSGKITDVVNEGYRSAGVPNRDMEGIAWFPPAGTVFVSGEKDNAVYEYSLDGRRTGRQLTMPSVFASATGNYGLESLTYNSATHRFWTTTESTLPADGPQASPSNPVRNRLRLQSFDDRLQPAEQYLYETDEPAVRKPARHYAMGVSELCALDDGRLLVLEREFFSSSASVIPYANVSCKLYMVNPSAAPQPLSGQMAAPQPALMAASQPLSGQMATSQPALMVASQPEPVLEKELVAEFRTKLNLLRQNLANYEGMCLGPKLADGSRVLIMVSDSQNRYKGVLRDWFRTIVVR